MSGYEPSRMEIRLTLWLGRLAGSFYKRYVDRLELTGAERALDFGSGSGVCSRFLAARLVRGGGRLTCMDVSRGWMAVIRKTLRKYKNVDYCLTDLSTDTDTSGLPDGSFDVVFIHFALHEVPAADMARVAGRLAGKLIPGGKLFIREPVENGGMQAGDFRAVLERAGLKEIRSARDHFWYTGPMYEGVYQKIA